MRIQRYVPGVVAAIAIIIASIGGCGGVAPVPPVFTKSNYTMKSAKEAEKISSKPLLVMATASWCGPCQQLKKGALLDSDVVAIIEEKTLPVYLDVDENQDVAGELSVMSVPTLFLIRDGKVISKVSGTQTAESLKSWLNAALVQK